MKCFCGERILYQFFQNFFLVMKDMLRTIPILCEGVDQLGEQKFQRMSSGAYFFFKRGEGGIQGSLGR